MCQLPASRLIFATILFLVAFLFRITRERYPVSSLCWIGGSIELNEVSLAVSLEELLPAFVAL